MDISLTFLLAGIMLMLGFVGDYLFKRSGIPDILILVSLGFLLGPVFGVVDVEALAPVTPVFASLALLIILFDGGLHMNLFKTLKSSPRAMMLAFLGMAVSMILTSAFLNVFFQWDILTGLLLGAVLGGTSSAIVIPIMSRMKGTDQKTSMLLNLESVFTDALVVVIAITLLQLIANPSGGNQVTMVLNGITSQFSIGIVVGGIVGLLWLKALKYIRGQLYDDVLTLAVVLLFYALVQTVGGSGPIFALTFGLVLANGYIISSMLKMKDQVEATGVMKKFQSQISFLIRTFFFVYLGLIISFQNMDLLLIGVAISAILLIGRVLSVALTSVRDAGLRSNRAILILMLPRGLAAAVMAQIVSTSGIPGGEVFADISIAVIITTVLIASIGSFMMANKKPGSDSSSAKKKR